MNRDTGEIEKFETAEQFFKKAENKPSLVPITEEEAKEAETKTLEERVAWLEKRLADMEAERRINDCVNALKGVNDPEAFVTGALNLLDSGERCGTPGCAHRSCAAISILELSLRER